MNTSMNRLFSQFQTPAAADVSRLKLPGIQSGLTSAATSMKSINHRLLMKTKGLIRLLAVGAFALALAGRAHALSLTLQPSVQTIGVGDSATVDIIISGLGDFASPSLGAFDFELSYDSSILSADLATFGTLLDAGIPGASLQFSDLTSPGTVRLHELSFHNPDELNTLQPGSFTLALLSFSGLSGGISAVDFSLADLSGESGESLLDFSTTAASIQVTPAVSVPEISSTGCLLVMGVGLLALFRQGAAACSKSLPHSADW
ncbi:MAG: cohesin domain-containing protein [Verrucomicrobiales bacterium]|nr:cohesin domain-containing protein [Verrucomicrobiales bacterium]